MAAPLFTVIIPAYNRARVLPRAINSVLNQTIADFELVIVEDGSTDSTDLVVSGIADARLRYVTHESNRGQNQALNTGISLAKGEFISFLDSDDEWLPHMLERVLEKFRSGNDVGCVYTLYGIRYSDGDTQSPIGNRFEGSIYPTALALGEISPPSALTVRKTCFDAVGTFDLNPVVCQDDIMCLKLAKAFKFGCVQERLAVMHYDAGERVSADPVLTAEGYFCLADIFAADTVRYCGRKILAERYAFSGRHFLRANNRSGALRAFWKSLICGHSLLAISYLAFALLPYRFQQTIRKTIRWGQTPANA